MELERNPVTTLKGADQDQFYVVPEEIGLARQGIPGGYELIKKAPVTLERCARQEGMAKYKLATVCKKYGANVILDCVTERFVRNSIGFSFYMYKVKGVPAVMAKPSTAGKFTKDELEDSLHVEECLADAKRSASVKKGNFILKAFAAVLVVIFFIGFLLSK